MIIPGHEAILLPSALGNMIPYSFRRFIESLFEAGKAAEMGFAAVLSIEPLLVLLQKNGIKILMYWTGNPDCK